MSGVHCGEGVARRDCFGIMEPLQSDLSMTIDINTFLRDSKVLIDRSNRRRGGGWWCKYKIFASNRAFAVHAGGRQGYERR